MARYVDTASAAADGFSIEHREDEHRFVIVNDGDVIGYAHYRLIGEDGIDFDSTVVREEFRGTGLSRLLVRHAVGDDLVRGRDVHASCWFVAGFLRRHPGALAEGATFPG